jgi:hypothetical protein
MSSCAYASPSWLPTPSPGSLPTRGTALWPGGIRTRWTEVPNFRSFRVSPSFQTSLSWSQPSCPSPRCAGRRDRGVWSSHEGQTPGTECRGSESGTIPPWRRLILGHENLIAQPHRLGGLRGLAVQSICAWRAPRLGGSIHLRLAGSAAWRFNPSALGGLRSLAVQSICAWRAPRLGG